MLCLFYDDFPIVVSCGSWSRVAVLSYSLEEYYTIKKRAYWFALHKNVGKSHVGKVAINPLAALVNILLLFTWLRDHPHGQPVFLFLLGRLSQSYLLRVTAEK